MLRTIHRALFTLLLLGAAVGALADAPHWIDVRTAGEFEAGHVEGAVNIPYEDIVDRIGEVTANKDDVIYVYCRSGRRSGIALEALQQAGFDNVVNLGGLEDAQRFAADQRIAK